MQPDELSITLEDASNAFSRVSSAACRCFDFDRDTFPEIEVDFGGSAQSSQASSASLRFLGGQLAVVDESAGGSFDRLILPVFGLYLKAIEVCRVASTNRGRSSSVARAASLPLDGRVADAAGDAQVFGRLVER